MAVCVNMSANQEPPGRPGTCTLVFLQVHPGSDQSGNLETETKLQKLHAQGNMCRQAFERVGKTGERRPSDGLQSFYGEFK